MWAIRSTAWATFLALLAAPAHAEEPSEPTQAPSFHPLPPPPVGAPAEVAPRSQGLILEVTRLPGAESCPDGPSLLSQVRKHRGAAPEPVGSPPLTLTITFSAGSAGLAAMVYVSGRRAGVRRLADPGPDCAALADAVVVTLAMTLDEFLAAPVPEPGMAEPRAAEKHPQVTYAALPSQFAAGSPPRRDRPSFWVGPGVALTSGLPQGVSWMLTARAGLDVRRISVALGGFWSSRRRVEFTPQPIEVKLAGGSIELCYAVVGNPTAWRADICPLVGLGALTGDARATTYSGRTAETQPWFAPGARAELRGPVAGPLQLALGATFLVPITPNRFYVENATPEFKSKPGIRMGAELIVKLW